MFKTFLIDSKLRVVTFRPYLLVQHFLAIIILTGPMLVKILFQLVNINILFINVHSLSLLNITAASKFSIHNEDLFVSFTYFFT